MFTGMTGTQTLQVWQWIVHGLILVGVLRFCIVPLAQIFSKTVIELRRIAANRRETPQTAEKRPGFGTNLDENAENSSVSSEINLGKTAEEEGGTCYGVSVNPKHED